MIESMLIIIGSVIMIGNIVQYILFMHRMHRVVVFGEKSNTFWLATGECEKKSVNLIPSMVK